MARFRQKSGWFGGLKPLLAISCFLLVCAGSSGANVGETITQLEAHLGTCVDCTRSQRLYWDKADFCLVTYHDGVITAEDHFTPVAPELRKYLFVPALQYPMQARPAGEGIGLYKIRFAAAGQPSTVDVVQSANSILDGWTEHMVPLLRWKGPTNTSITLAIAYHSDRDSKVYGAR